MSADPFLNEADGTKLYVVREESFAGSNVHEWLVPAESLAAAKAAHGYVPMRYTSRSIRRARQSDARLVRSAS